MSDRDTNLFVDWRLVSSIMCHPFKTRAFGQGRHMSGGAS